MAKQALDMCEKIESDVFYMNNENEMLKKIINEQADDIRTLYTRLSEIEKYISSRKTVKHCSWCKSTDHNIRTCVHANSNTVHVACSNIEQNVRVIRKTTT